MGDVTVTSLTKLQNEVRYGDGRTFIIDEPGEVGGDDAGPDPFTLLLSALGGCISMTVTLYARRKNWPLERATVNLSQKRVHHADCQDCENKDSFVHRIERTITFDGPLSDEQRARLAEIARMCPVHKALSSKIEIIDRES